MELTRKQVIEELQKMLDYCSIRQDSTPERKQALVYAISSLKTDEAYQLMYEGGEIYTKADIVNILEELKKEIIELPFPQREPEYMKGYSYCQMNILDYVIQDKINALRCKI